MHKKILIIPILLGLFFTFSPHKTEAASPTYNIVYYEVASHIGNTSKAQWLSKAIVYAGSVYQVDPLLIAAVMEIESGFRMDAISSAGAIGLMQLMPDTAKSYGVNPYEPFKNIMGGTAYLKDLLTSFKGHGQYRITYAIAGYNAGGYEVMNNGVRYAETRDYVKKINNTYRRLLTYRR